MVKVSKDQEDYCHGYLVNLGESVQALFVRDNHSRSSSASKQSAEALEYTLSATNSFESFQRLESLQYNFQLYRVLKEQDYLGRGLVPIKIRVRKEFSYQ